jgi:hypothetical protein
MISLRYDGTCSACACSLSAGTKAWWDSATKQATCPTCSTSQPGTTLTTPACTTVTEPSAVVDAAPATFPPPPTIDHGIGGISATKEYERRIAKHAKQIEAKWGTGRIGRFAKFMSDEPQSTLAWAKGAEGERKLARRLTDELSEVAIVLHDRKVPKTRGNIDHLVVAPNGIWIVDAKNYTGKVERRDIGGWFSTNNQLFVDGRNQTKLITGLEWQMEAVRAVLAPTGFADMPVYPSLCFTDSEWGLFAKPIRIDGVLIAWPAKLLESIRAPGVFDAITIDMLARELSSRLPASS